MGRWLGVAVAVAVVRREKAVGIDFEYCIKCNLTISQCRAKLARSVVNDTVIRYIEYSYECTVPTWLGQFS